MSDYVATLPVTGTTVEFFEFWNRDPRTGWTDYWIEVPALGVKYGFNFPMVRDANG
jgi:hypothetical protein